MEEVSSPTRITDLLFASADKWPAKPAISFNGKTQDWLETKNRCIAAATLLKELGVNPGDRVAFLGSVSYTHLTLPTKA